MISDVQEGLCNFALKEYFDMLHFIIYIHRNPKILAFIFQNISNNHGQSCPTSVKNKTGSIKTKCNFDYFAKKKSQ